MIVYPSFSEVQFIMLLEVIEQAEQAKSQGIKLLFLITELIPYPIEEHTPSGKRLKPDEH